jgi:hypothetical protein
MTELAKGLQEPEKSAIVHASDLLTHYSFDLGDRTVSHLTQHWLKDFSASWIRSAVIEALYQGRYKAVSVDQILLLWKRRNQPCYHFNYEFERLVCNKFPRDLRQRSPKVSPVELDNPQPTLEEANPVSIPSDAEEPVPAWVALAEQIQRDDVSEPIGELGIEGLSAPVQLDEFEHNLEPADPLIGVERSPASVEALLEQSATKQILGEAEASLSLIDAIEEPEESQPPIHQFTPPPSVSDFHSKLKAVAESGGEESS